MKEHRILNERIDGVENRRVVATGLDDLVNDGWQIIHISNAAESQEDWARLVVVLCREKPEVAP